MADKIKIIDPFTNIDLLEIPVATQENQGATFLSNLRELNIGDGGLNVFRADTQGIWLGGKTFAAAPFRVSMAGVVTASSLAVTGGSITMGTNAWHVDNSGNMWWGNYASYALAIAGGGYAISAAGIANLSGLVVGTNVGLGTAQDSAGVTTIIGGVVTTGYINALSITVLGAVTAGSLSGVTVSIGTGNNIFKADANGIYLGNAVFGSAPFRVSMAGAVTASSLTLTNASIGAGSSYAGNVIAAAYIGDLTAAKITSGTLQIGSANQPGAITIIQSALNDAGLLRWSGGSKLWEDTSNYLGINSVGERIYFYTGVSAMYALFQRYAQASFYTGISCQGNFNVGVPNSTTPTARFTGIVYFNPTAATTSQINGGTTTWSGTTYYNSMSYNAEEAHAFFINGNAVCRMTPTGFTTLGYFYNAGQNYMEFKDYRLTLTANKTAILPTSKGFRALYCTEAPEVWFMDFCKSKDEIDPLFLEVTVAPYHFIKCEGGEYQVWGKRKGHENKRFEIKTVTEFEANEKFLNMSKPN